MPKLSTLFRAFAPVALIVLSALPASAQGLVVPPNSVLTSKVQIQVNIPSGSVNYFTLPQLSLGAWIMSLDSNCLVSSPSTVVSSSAFASGQTALVSVGLSSINWGGFLQQIPIGTSFLVQSAYTDENLGQDMVNVVLVPQNIPGVDKLQLIFKNGSVPSSLSDVTYLIEKFLGLGQ